MKHSSESVTLGDQRLAELISTYNEQFSGADPGEILKWGVKTFGSGIVLGTGFGSSGMVLIHRIHSLKLNIPVFYLDTQLLFDETYALRDELKKQFDIRIARVSPSLNLKEQKRQYGEKLWESDPNRCCELRKVQPLKEYLADKQAWVSGLRRSQSETRKRTQIIEWDPTNEVVKINPLAQWSEEEVWSYIHINELPYNPLHDEGYPSIGCIPCTHSVAEGEDGRAGRWRGTKKTECGIHSPSQNYQNGYQE